MFSRVILSATIAGSAAIGLMTVQSSVGSTVVDPQIAIGTGAGTSDANGSAGQEPNQLGSLGSTSFNNFSLYMNGGAYANSLLVAIIVPDVSESSDLTGNPFGTITIYPDYKDNPGTASGTNGYSMFVGTTTGTKTDWFSGSGSGTTSSTNSGLWTDWNDSSLNAFLGTGGGSNNSSGFNSSVSVSNLITYDSKLGVNTNIFDVYTVNIKPKQSSNPELSPGALVNVAISTSLPLGTLLAVTSDYASTWSPWTVSGGVNGPYIPTPVPAGPVPTPATLPLVVGGLVGGVGLLLWQRVKKNARHRKGYCWRLLTTTPS